MWENIWNLFKIVNRTCRFYLPIAILVALTAFVGPVTTVLVPKIITDQLMQGMQLEGILWIILLITIANFIRMIGKILFEERYAPSCQIRLQQLLNLQLMDKVKKIDMASFDTPTFRDQYNRAQQQADQGIISFLKTSMTLFDRLVYVGTVISIISALDPFLIIFSGICVASLFFFNTKISGYKYDTEKIVTKHRRKADYVKRTFYLADYAEDLRMLPLGNRLKTDYIEANQSIRDTIINRSKVLSLFKITDEGLRVFILEFVTMTYLALRVISGGISVSAFVALFLATVQLCNELFGFISCFSEFHKISLTMGDLNAVLNYHATIEGEASTENAVAISGFYSLATERVCFTYPNTSREILHNIKFRIKQGEHIALVGDNGTGKTTLIRLLLRLYDPTQGTILLNGQDIRSLPADAYRSHFGIVSQNYHYYAMSIAENILLRKVERDEDRQCVIQALKQSDLYEYVRSLPNGMDTILSNEFDDEGIRLSGGQAQKLALARVFAMKDKEVLIMDEASAALDPISESRINQAILEFAKGKTLFLVSHRLSAVKGMDQIYLIYQGEIQEHGTHEELIAQQGKYAAMWTVQSEKYKDEIAE